MNNLYNMVKSFKRRYPMTISWRLKAHCRIIDKHINPDEKVLFAFAAQKNNNPLDMITTYVIALTDRRILLAQKRLLFGYFFTAVTPDMFNDLKVQTGLIWGKVYIDTIKEFIELSNIDKNALAEIESNITDRMMKEKKKYGLNVKKK